MEDAGEQVYDDGGNAVYRSVLPAEEAAVLDAGLEAIRAELDRRATDASAEAGSPQEAVLPGLEQVPGASAETRCPPAAGAEAAGASAG